MPEAPPDFQCLLKRLSAANVRFVLIGGLAMVAHGSSYVTRDVDLGYDRSPSNLKALASALAPFHPRLRDLPTELPFMWDERALQIGMNFTLVTDKGDVDLLGHTPGVFSFEELWDESIEMELYGERVQVASLDHLIAMKHAANRPKDQAHLLELEALRSLRSGNPQWPSSP